MAPRAPRRSNPEVPPPPPPSLSNVAMFPINDTAEDQLLETVSSVSVTLLLYCSVFNFSNQLNGRGPPIRDSQWCKCHLIAVL